MGKLGYIGVFVVVAIAHFYALQSTISKQTIIAKPKAKVQRITLTSIVVKKPVVVPPKPVVTPVVLPPEPVVEKRLPKPKVKKKRIKRVHKKHRPKPKPPKPEIKEIVPVVKPVVEQVVTPLAKVNTASIKDQYLSKIRRAVKKHLYYPKIAKRMRMQGVVNVSFSVLQDGTITQISIINGAKRVLKDGAMKTLKSLSLDPIPSELGEKSMDIKLPIVFKLREG